ncbi:unnamed protein product [Blepharisma stoltei]|uniref:Uncharacterized protein n=1 Tax=Blepharisma stoltei TaxID=1481888 RepID=A0AAU9J9D2_9CILI|nr:unnamed protein product [Blepharisma stoltei]
MKEDYQFPAIGTIPTSDTNYKSLTTLTSNKPPSSSRSQVRIKKYMKLYGKSLTLKPTTSQGKSTGRFCSNLSNQIETEPKPTSLSHNIGFAKPISHPFTRYSQLVSEKEKTVNIERLKKKIDKLLYAIQKASSDKIELTRDLASYESEFSKEKQLSVELARLRVSAMDLPDITYLTNGNLNENKTVEKINNGLLLLGSPDLNYSNATAKNDSEIDWEKYSTRKVLKINKLDTVFQGVVQISSVNCIISIRSDQWLEVLDLTVQAFEGEQFHLNLKLSISNTYQEPDQVRSTVRNNIAPYLFFMKEQNCLNLFYDSRHSVSFFSIITKIRGYGLCSIQLTEIEEDHVHIQVDFHEEALEVLKEEITYESSIFYESISKLTRIIEQHLCYIKKSKSLYWQQDYYPGFIFSMKEDSSKFMDDEYLAEVMEMVSFVKLYSFFVVIKKVRFDIEVMGWKNYFMIKIKNEGDFIEISSDSKNYRYLRDLQSFYLEKGLNTLKTSLEFEALVRRVFPRAFKAI